MYSDHIAPGHGIYYIEQNGSYYRLTTFAGGGLFPFDLFLEAGLVLLGFGVGVVGADNSTVGRPRLRLGIAGYGGVMLLAAALSTSTLVRMWLLLGAFAGSMASLLTVGYLRWRRE